MARWGRDEVKPRWRSGDGQEDPMEGGGERRGTQGIAVSESAFDGGTALGVAGANHSHGRQWSRSGGNGAGAGCCVPGGREVAQAVGRTSGTKRGEASGRRSSLRCARHIHGGKHLRDHGAGVRAAGKERASDHALEPERVGRRGGQAQDRPKDFAKVGGAFFKIRPICSPIAAATG